MIKEITALEAWEMLNSIDNAILVDTRTPEEWTLIGSPIFQNKVIRISSHLKPSMNINQSFLSELQNKIKDANDILIFMCKTSGRSRIAAELAKDVGYKNCFVISDGFEGSTTGAGWRDSKLPFEML